MDCRDCESVLVDYALGELPEDKASECRAHIDKCAACREEMSKFSCLERMMQDSPEATPTSAESARLSRALDEMALPQPRVPWATELVPRGLPAFVAACVLAFMLIASLLSFLAFGAVDVRSAAIGTRPGALICAAVMVVFITSFVPIAVTAKRRPLNGMTFRR